MNRNAAYRRHTDSHWRLAAYRQSLASADGCGLAASVFSMVVRFVNRKYWHTGGGMGEAEQFITVQSGGHGRYEEKKSVFLGECAHVESADEAMDFVREIRKKNYDARHNCYAWSIGVVQPELHASDDGEPSGTAGRPILDVLTGAGVTDAVIVVTRYFGGTLLGTGGLVRAYKAAAKDCLEKSRLITKICGKTLRLTLDYTDVGRVQHFLEERKIRVLSSEYADKVMMQLILPETAAAGTVKALTELTAGRTHIEEGEKQWYEAEPRT